LPDRATKSEKMEMTEKRPKVGLAIIILKENKVLLGKRKNAHDAGAWAFPGGHLEWYESFSDCANREVKEEIGLEIELIDKNPIAITNDFFLADEKHYITLFLRARIKDNQAPKLMEPDWCEEWNWFEWEKLPDNLMIPIKNLIKQEYNPFKT